MKNVKQCGNRKCKYDQCWINAETCERCGWSFKLQRLPRNRKVITDAEENEFASIVNRYQEQKEKPPEKLNKDCPKCHHPCWYKAVTCENCRYDFVQGIHPDDVPKPIKKEKRAESDLRKIYPFDYSYVYTNCSVCTTLKTKIVLVPTLYTYCDKKNDVNCRSAGLPFPRKEEGEYSVAEEDVMDWAERMMLFGKERDELFTTTAMLNWASHFWSDNDLVKANKVLIENSVDMNQFMAVEEVAD